MKYLVLLLILFHSTLSSILISTWNFREATEEGWKRLSSGGSALDAVEAACTKCEENQCDGTVGYGGSPDEKGKTTLDALIMDGSSMEVGSVASLHDVKEATKVARLVLHHSKHSLLVGEAATNFAISMGLKRSNLTTEESFEVWKEWKTRNCQPNFWQNVFPDPKISCGPYKPINKNKYSNPDNDKKLTYLVHHQDTIGVVAIDNKSHIASATSSNGAKFKTPGRVGDSPIVGAGGYAEDGVGGAVATGDGDYMMRFSPSFYAVDLMSRGLSPQEASKQAINKIRKYFPTFQGAVVALNYKQQFGAACNGFGSFPFTLQRDEDSSVQLYHVDCS